MTRPLTMPRGLVVRNCTMAVTGRPTSEASSTSASGESGALTIRESPTSDPTEESPPPVPRRRRELTRPLRLLTRLWRLRRLLPRPGGELVPASLVPARVASLEQPRGSNRIEDHPRRGSEPPDVVREKYDKNIIVMLPTICSNFTLFKNCKNKI